MRLKILQRYVLVELIGPTLLGLIVFTFVLLATHLFRLMDLLVNRGVPLPLFAALVGTLLPPLVVLTTPMAVLVGVLLGVGRLAADNEIMAMRTSGVDLLRIFVPVFIVGLLLTAFLWRANGTWVPELVRSNVRLIDQIKFIVASRIEAGRVISPESDSDVELYFRRRNPITQRIEGVTLKVVVTDAEDQRKKTNMIISALEGRIEPHPFAGYMNIILTSGSLHHLDASSTGPQFRHVVAMFDTLEWQLRLRSEDRATTKPHELTNDEIVGAIETGKLPRKKLGALRAELHQRRSIPLACLAFMLLGIPLAIRVRPTGKAVAFSIAFGLIFFYYVMLKWGASLCQGGSALGAFVIFLPNLLVGGTGVAVLYFMLRR